MKITDILTGRDNKTAEFVRCMSLATWVMLNGYMIYSLYTDPKYTFSINEYAKSCVYIITGGALGIALKSWSAPPQAQPSEDHTGDKPC